MAPSSSRSGVVGDSGNDGDGFAVEFGFDLRLHSLCFTCFASIWELLVVSVCDKG